MNVSFYFSSPEPLAHGELLSPLDVCCALSTIALKDISQTTDSSITNLTGVIIIWLSFIFVQIFYGPLHI